MGSHGDYKWVDWRPDLRTRWAILVTMMQIAEKAIIEEVADVAQGLGYKVTRQPMGIPTNRAWTSGIAAFFRSRRYKPDMLIENNSSYVLVEVKSRPVLLGAITHTKRYTYRFEGRVVICMPDNSYQRTPVSVKNYAKSQKIGLCPVSTIGTILEGLLD